MTLLTVEWYHPYRLMRQDSHLSIRTIVLYTEEEESGPLFRRIRDFPPIIPGKDHQHKHATGQKSGSVIHTAHVITPTIMYTSTTHISIYNLCRQEATTRIYTSAHQALELHDVFIRQPVRHGNDLINLQARS